MARIPLWINKRRLTTLEELRENFNLLELVERFRSGQLRAWLHCWEFETELEQLETLASDLPEAELAKALCRIFGIERKAKEQALRELNEEKIRQEEEQQRREEEQRRQQEEQQRQVVQKEWRFKISFLTSFFMRSKGDFGFETLPSGSSVEWHRSGTDLFLRSLSDSPPTEKEIRDFVNKSWVILPDEL